MSKSTDWGSVAIAAAVIYGIYVFKDVFKSSDSGNSGGSFFGVPLGVSNTTDTKEYWHEVYRESLGETKKDTVDRISGASLVSGGKYENLAPYLPYGANGSSFGTTPPSSPIDTTDKSFTLKAHNTPALSYDQAVSAGIFGNVMTATSPISAVKSNSTTSTSNPTTTSGGASNTITTQYKNAQGVVTGGMNLTQSQKNVLIQKALSTKKK